MNEETIFDAEAAVAYRISQRSEFDRISERRLQEQNRPATSKEDFGARQVEFALTQMEVSDDPAYREMLEEGYFLMGEFDKAGEKYREFADAVKAPQCACIPNNHKIDSIGRYDFFRCLTCRRLSASKAR